MSTQHAEVRIIHPFIDGKRLDAINGEYIDRLAPGTNEIVSRVASSTRQEVESAILVARRTFDKGVWSNTTGLQRARILNLLADLIDRDRDWLARVDAEESGKTIRVAIGDVTGAADLCRYAASLAINMQGKSFTNNGSDFTGLVVREPVGVVGLIVPWNFPTLILCQKLPFALAAGNTSVIKPSEFTSSSAFRIAELAAEAGVPDGVINLVTGAGDVGEAITASDWIDLVSFTGSTATGKRVLAAASGNMKKTSLELGGKAASVVFDDADIEDALEAVVFGITFNNGECCVSQPRLIVQQGISDDFVKELSRRMAQVKVGQPLDSTSDMGALIHASHRERVLGFISGSVSHGAEVISGGNALNGGEFGAGQFVEPTIIDNVESSASVFQDEIFGPVLTVTRFDNSAEAVSLVNSVKYGLSNSVWSKNIDTVLDTAKALKSGTIYANTTIDAPVQMPFGGYKASGSGREMGDAGFEEYTELKSINIRTGQRAGKFIIPAFRQAIE